MSEPPQTAMRYLDVGGIYRAGGPHPDISPHTRDSPPWHLVAGAAFIGLLLLLYVLYWKQVIYLLLLLKLLLLLLLLLFIIIIKIK